MRMNANMNNEIDYLALLNPPVYTAGEELRYVNIPSRESPVSEEDFELKPMLRTTGERDSHSQAHNSSKYWNFTNMIAVGFNITRFSTI